VLALTLSDAFAGVVRSVLQPGGRPGRRSTFNRHWSGYTTSAGWGGRTERAQRSREGSDV